MENQITNYTRVAKAIEYIKTNFQSQPSLEEIAKNINLSPYYFQRLFIEWAGVSPKKFLQYISLDYAKDLLKEKRLTLFNTVHETVLSGSGKPHDLFVKIEGMTPDEYKNGGENLQIYYSYAESPFGMLIVASTSKGICHLAFTENEKDGLSVLKLKFSKATYLKSNALMHQNVLSIFKEGWTELDNIKLHLRGTEFQIKVWEVLLKLPAGKLTTYGTIAEQIKKPNASRAVGTAIGDNPIAFLIPCHRVIQSGGGLGGYMWGKTRKTAIIGWEAAFTDLNKHEE
jgi:AraC family transcriptional regulator, regulatory protein of adaptative response / methylated-DNA-[protein]-cysteine methyltransferase